MSGRRAPLLADPRARSRFHEVAATVGDANGANSIDPMTGNFDLWGVHRAGTAHDVRQGRDWREWSIAAIDLLALTRWAAAAVPATLLAFAPARRPPFPR
jgi:hypothetical protein